MAACADELLGPPTKRARLDELQAYVRAALSKATCLCFEGKRACTLAPFSISWRLPTMRHWQCHSTLPSIAARQLAATAALILVSGCGPITTIRPDGFVERHYIGYVKVLVPDSQFKEGRVSASDISAIGLRIENGVGVGYFRDREITTPLDCRVVFLAKDREQLKETVDLLHNKMGGNNLCATVF